MVKTQAPSRHSPAIPNKISWFEFLFLKHPFLSTLVTTLVILGLTAITLNFIYQICDDTFVLLLLKGVGMVQTPSEYNFFLNTALSMFLNVLYAHFPAVQWYSVFLVLVETLSLWAILLACRWGAHSGLKTLLTLAGGGVYVYLLTLLQWTMVSAFAAMAGFILLLTLWREKDQKPHGIALTLIFVLFMSSVLIRPAAFFLILILGLPASVLMGWKAILSPARSTLLKLLGATAVMVVLCMGFNAREYHRNPEWAQAVQFFNLHSDLINGHHLYYDETTKPIFDSIGWTSNDLDLFINWYFLDETTYSAEKLEKLRSSFARFDMKKNALESPQNIFFLPSVQCVFWSALFLLFFVPRSSARFLLVNAIWTFLVLAALALYLKLPERIFLPALMLFMNLVIFNAVPKDQGSGGTPRNVLVKRIGFGILVLVSFVNLQLLRWEKNVSRDLTEVSPHLLETLNGFTPQRDHLYVIWDSAFPYELIGAFDNFEFFRKMNLVTLAWFQRTPTTKAMLERFGVKNLFVDLVDNPKLHLICTEWEANAYKVFMIQKFNRQIELVPDYSSTFFTDYLVRSGKKP